MKTTNLDGATKPDIVLDLEKPLLVPDVSYDGVLLINVLEHIFEYRQLLTESARVMKPGGTIVIVVPFLFPYHPSPSDFHRYTAAALERALSASGFSDIAITPLGSGVGAAQFVMMERLLPVFSFLGPLATLFDYIFTGLARFLGKKYKPADYALGYVVTARKR